MKPDLVPWGNWFQSPRSYGFSCWQDWFEGEPKCQRQLPLLRRTLKDVMMIVNRLRTHMHTISYNKLVKYNWFPQYRTWDWCKEDTGGGLCPIVEEIRNLEFAEGQTNWLPSVTLHSQLVVPQMQEALVLLTDHLHMQTLDFHVVSGLSYTKAMVTSCILLVYMPFPDQSFEYQVWCFRDRKKHHQLPSDWKAGNCVIQEF